ncbi:uncharacterized protein LOC130788979 [Actinidia eriantha]|uniref:uncharacterized protein LOC130788979 n=1 Tax=Actinidia eriantha TaxID=165200 RepID=UPI00258DD19E|nr:uncharacterized protein LOC130788979 [Actinidia eriantha]
MTQCYILASMSNVLQHQHQFMPTTYDMMMSLKEMIRDQNRATRFVAMRDLMNTTMVEETPVRDHVLKMISLLNKLKILGSNIDGKTQVDIILQSLPNFFKQFCLKYNMKKFSYSMAEFQVAEGIINKPIVAHVAEKGSTSKLKRKKKKKKV